MANGGVGTILRTKSNVVPATTLAIFTGPIRIASCDGKTVQYGSGIYGECIDNTVTIVHDIGCILINITAENGWRIDEIPRGESGIVSAHQYNPIGDDK